MYKVLIVYRSTADAPNCSHAGLGICAINTAKTLAQYGIWAKAFPVTRQEQVEAYLAISPDITHVLIQAPWMGSKFLFHLSDRFHDVRFAVNCHSNVGFLQADPGSVTRILDLLELEQTSVNLHCSGNNLPFVEWIEEAYSSPCAYLPNLYYLDRHCENFRPLWNGGVLRIGIFGATRPQKNVMTGACAAIEIAQHLKTQTEIWVNAGREEKHGKVILDAVKKAVSRNPFCTFKEFPWAWWPEFRRHIGSMNLLIQASYTESFNQVTADGVATGVPSVVSPAIRWAPDYWMCDVDSVDSVARIGTGLIRNPHAHRDGVRALREHNDSGIIAWRHYLSGRDFRRD